MTGQMSLAHISVGEVYWVSTVIYVITALMGSCFLIKHDASIQIIIPGFFNRLLDISRS